MSIKLNFLPIFQEKWRNNAFFKIDFSFLLTFFIALIIGEIKIYICFCVFTILHELAHFFVAKKLGYMAKKISLNFFGASLEGLDDFSLQDEIKIVLAGPLFNLFVIVCCYLSFWFYPESFNYLQEVLIANIGIFVFNFLPVFPLDLGRLILSILSIKNDRVVALKKTKRISFIFIIFLFIIFLISFFFEFNFTFGFVCVNLAVLSFKEGRDCSFKRQMFVERKLKLLKKGLIERNIYVKASLSIYSLFKHIDDYHFINFFFIDDNFNVVDSLSEIEFYKKMGLM